MWRIFVPLKFLAIKHAEKWKFELLLPAIACAIACLPLLSSTFRGTALGEFDILGKSLGFVSPLAGFYIAALAAVATFGRAEMDEPMSGDQSVTLRHTRAGVKYEEDLTRRRFLSFLFGYLAFASLVITVIGVSYAVFDKFFLGDYKDIRPYLFSIFWVFYTFLFGNVLSNTLLGLFYLTDRMHRPNPGLRWKQSATPAE